MFTEMQELILNDHEFAAYLAKRGALDNYVNYGYGDMNEWRDGNNKLVARAVYNNAKCTYRVFVPKRQA